jgi:GH25 family lysozyme M1 (1,4-beta-N-acetylmuramidase)
MYYVAKFIDSIGLVCALNLSLSTIAKAQTYDHRPWENPHIPILIDPYAPTKIDINKAATDRRLRAIIHKASQGRYLDPKFLARAEQAKKRGLLWGAYHFGMPGDPIVQADILLSQARKTGAKFLALDIEEDNPRRYMSLKNAEKFIAYVHKRTGRYPAVYVNYVTFRAISRKYNRHSIFAKTPLWIARYRSTHGLDDKSVWQNYTFWQFSSEANCNHRIKCYYRVPGTTSITYLNVFRGNEKQLRYFFQ